MVHKSAKFPRFNRPASHFNAIFIRFRVIFINVALFSEHLFIYIRILSDIFNFSKTMLKVV